MESVYYALRRDILIDMLAEAPPDSPFEIILSVWVLSNYYNFN